MPHRDWNESYASGELPWDTGLPEPLLVEFVNSGGISGGRALDVGAGTGTNAIWLAEHGFDVLGIDISSRAVEKAQAKIEGRRLPCQFSAMDFLDRPPDGSFRFVFDRGCFHVFDEAEERTRFAERVAALLEPRGLWLSIIGSTEGLPREVGPPRRAAREVVLAIEPALEIIELRSTDFHDHGAKAWFCVSRRRTNPAQPSTRHG